MTPILLLGFAADTFHPENMALIEQAAQAANLEVVQTRDRDTIEEILDRVQVAAGSFPHDLLPRASRLRWLQQWGAGADWLMQYPEVRELDFILTNVSGIHAIPISEHIFGLLLAFSRRLPDSLRAQDDVVWLRNNWERNYALSNRAGRKYLPVIDRDDVFELAGKTMLIAGVGEIGVRTARLARAFDMRVIGVRRNPSRTAAGVDEMVGPDAMLDALTRADIAVNALPYTEETRHIFGDAAFAALPNHAVYITIGRGGTTDEDALVQALESNAIAWAGLDVFETEPLPPESPLWRMGNVFITPHYSGLSPEYDRRGLAIFLDNLARYRAGQPLRNVVDKRLGY
ncbi:MAG: D-2-hydroxyacid dehydrogenase [Caldilineaceae bacterium]|nr:D-2-hydroxyacid dehydrogenase [Caldilineaceae bacterium]